MGSQSSKTENKSSLKLADIIQNKPVRKSRASSVNLSNYNSQRKLKCKVPLCTENHQTHYCKFCKIDDIDHFSSQCPNNPNKSANDKASTADSNISTVQSKPKQNCQVQLCKQDHKKHYCKVCTNEDSNHFASQCPLGVVLYHGTTLQAAKIIQKSGFRPSQYGRLGKGIYLTPDLKIAANIGGRAKNSKNVDKFAVIQCRLTEDSQHVQKSLHPTWSNKIEKISDGPFVQYVVRQEFKKRIKVVKIHQI